MLLNLKIDNVALVDRAELTFDPGLSVLTGETGAGKSVIVTALALVLGGRAEQEYIRHGANEAAVEATFDVSSLPTRYKGKFSDYLDDNRLVVRRELSRDGNSKVRIGGSLSSVTRLKEVTEPLAEIVGQHAGQMLMNEDNHLRFLDFFASLEKPRESVGQLYQQWKQLHRELKEIREKRDQLIKERELLLYQKDEIEKADIRPGEEEKLLTERKIADAARTLMSSAEKVCGLLDGEEISALQMIRDAVRELGKMSEVDSSLEKKVSELTEIDFQLNEVRQYVERYGNSIVDDPERLEEINLRLDEIYLLKKKYGGSEESIVKSLEQINERLEDRPDIDSYIDGLTRQYESIAAEYRSEALALSEARHKAARYLQQLVVRELAELAIDNGGFEFEFIYDDHPEGVLMDGRAVRPFAHGLEDGRFLFSANPGEPLKSLVKTASGGEISRVLLALKSAARRNQRQDHSLLVFDEVDSGIGGQTAVEVGRKLKKLADKGQLIVITHLHQLARMADHHYVAEKKTVRGRSVISVHRLDQKARRIEIERMLALPPAGKTR